MVRKLHVVVLPGLIWASLAMAQTNATVSGTVTDPSGAHVVDAAISALNVATGVTTSGLTNDAGVYVFGSLPPGRYPYYRRTSWIPQSDR